MKKFIPKIQKAKKQAPATPLALIIIMWILWIAVIVIDIYRFFASGTGITVADLICDIGVLAVAIYLTIRRVKAKKQK